MREIAVLVHDSRWKGLGPTVKRAAEAALDSQRIGKATLAIVLTDNAEIQTLNHTYRGKNKPTNVLSFPDGHKAAGVRQLGDILLAYETIRAEAVAQEKPLKHHVTHLVVHGVLHLLGFDHEAEDEASAMESREVRILARMGIANPYETA